VPNLPTVRVQPIILGDDYLPPEYGTWELYKSFPPVYRNADLTQLIASRSILEHDGPCVRPRIPSTVAFPDKSGRSDQVLIEFTQLFSCDSQLAVNGCADDTDCKYDSLADVARPHPLADNCRLTDGF
jgi:hypothetical protein